jgi:hypothetical protein
MNTVRSGFAAGCVRSLKSLVKTLRRGFAAGCEAGLCPAGGNIKSNWAMPLVRALPAQVGLSPNQGHSPNEMLVATAGA